MQETAREGVEQMREITRGLRPQARDDFGLRSALIAPASGFSKRGRLDVRHRVTRGLPVLETEQDLAICRVAQESLTNAAHHADGATVELTLTQMTARSSEVCDDGCGMTEEHASGQVVGLGGMRERALLVGGRLTVGRRPEGGTAVRLEVPV